MLLLLSSSLSSPAGGMKKSLWSARGEWPQHRSLTNLLFDNKDNKNNKDGKNSTMTTKRTGGWFVTLERAKRQPPSTDDDSPWPCLESAVCFWLDGSPYRRRVRSCDRIFLATRLIGRT